MIQKLATWLLISTTQITENFLYLSLITAWEIQWFEHIVNVLLEMCVLCFNKIGKGYDNQREFLMEIFLESISEILPIFDQEVPWDSVGFLCKNPQDQLVCGRASQVCILICTWLSRRHLAKAWERLRERGGALEITSLLYKSSFIHSNGHLICIFCMDLHLLLSAY